MPQSKSFMVNFDGLVGPTHHYAGLSYGNIASIRNKNTLSNPKKAALQGLDKMRFLMELGVRQAVLPPHQRPYLPLLRNIGFAGTDEEVVLAAATQAPAILAQCYSASSMWAANVATVSPSSDTLDGKMHLTPANLNTMFHRRIETKATENVLHKIFHDTDHFVIHPPLPSHSLFSDEGAANQMRLYADSVYAGVEVFIYGKKEHRESIYPIRQQLEASQAIVRRHQLLHDRVVFAQQNPEVIDKGVFHNDVIAVGCKNFLFCHEKAYKDTASTLQEIQQKYHHSCGKTLYVDMVLESMIPIEDAVDTYLFNAQIVELPDNTLVLIAPEECRQHPQITAYFAGMVSNAYHPIKKVYYLDVRESMRNGGGPACLRLPMTMTSLEFQAIHQGVILTPALYQSLVAWIKKHYREELSPTDFGDIKLMEESYAALDELTQILNLGSLYDFQK